MEFTFRELAQLLRDDPALRLLFVEGVGDLALWRAIVPPAQRSSGAIYSANSITDELTDGGSRGRLLRLSEYLDSIGLSDRALFFVDSDNDYGIPQVSHCQNVMMTDCRDIEAYCLNVECLDRLCLIVLGMPQSRAVDACAAVDAVCIPISALRLASAAQGLKLPIQNSLERNWGRYAKANPPRIDVTRLQTALAQNSEVGLAGLDRLRTLYEASLKLVMGLPRERVSQGKDIVRTLSMLFGTTIDAISAHTRSALALSVDVLRSYPNLRVAADWVG